MPPPEQKFSKLSDSSWLRRLAVISILATTCGLTACSDDSSKDHEKQQICTDAKPSEDCSCKDDGTWECPSVMPCTCNDGSACPDGDKDKCGVTACICDDGTECPDGDKNKCGVTACTCDDGTECPDGDKNKCGVTACTCDDGTECPDGDKEKCISTTKCDETTLPQNITCICNETLGLWENCKYTCSELTKPDNATCNCNEAIGIWDNCVYTCDEANKAPNAKDCTCDDQSGQWQNCKYTCDDNNKPQKAESCDCDELTGTWKTDTCIYKCLDSEIAPNATGCTCDNTTGYWQNCTFTCPNEKPENAIESTCTCDDKTGDWNCTFKDCNEEDKDPKATSCVCNDESTWVCTYPACKDSDKPQFAETCDCIKGEWQNCVINQCMGKTLLTGQVCNRDTGEVSYDPAPKLIVSADKTSIKEKGGVATITVKLNAEPSKDVMLTINPASDSRISITEPSGKRIAKADWNKGVTYTVTAIDNSELDGNKNITFTIKTSGSDDVFNNLSATQTITIVDNDKPSIIVACKYGEVFSYFNGPGEDYLNPLYGKNDKYGGFKQSLMQRCTVSLGQKPTSDVYVTVSGERASSDIALPTVTMDGSEFKNFKTIFLTFTPENYNIQKEFYFTWPGYETKDISSSSPVKYTLTAESTQTNYQATGSDWFKVHPMARYYVLLTSLTEKSRVYLPKGKYRLHAWGASGGVPDAEFMAHTESAWSCTNHGGAGAYIHGDLTIDSKEYIVIRYGQPGTPGHENYASGSYNGGGAGRTGNSVRNGVGGGGATDFCIGSSDCDDDDKHWPYRILVAGGGGGGVKPGEGCKTNTDTGAGGSATWSGHSGNGLHHGAATNSSGNYYAEGGAQTGTLLRFGKGQNASDASASNGGYRRGGGGGGWYGGNAGSLDRDTGGGAGSSYAFTGSNQGTHGKQNAKYKLTNVGGSNGGANSTWYHVNGEWDERYLQFTTEFGYIGYGTAIIEVLDE